MGYYWHMADSAAGPATVDAFLLTNNPKKLELDADQLAAWIDATSEGKLVEENWSTGGTKKKIAAGDRAFLLRQGVSNRGIFASGLFTSSVYQYEHWDGSGALANYADVRWDTFLDPEDVLPIESLQSEFPSTQWEPQGSGTQIPGAVVAPLEAMWKEHVASVRSSARTTRPGTTAEMGYGRRIDASLHKQIEDVAQQRLMDYYSSRGWDVEDMRVGNSFDARATKGDEVIYLEAKGTVTAGEKVIVTRKEVAFARDHPGKCIMGVVSSIELTNDKVVDPASGILRLYPWEAREEDLCPLSYDFYPPEGLRGGPGVAGE